MAKLFKTSDDIHDFIIKEWENTGNANIGIGLKVISTPKARQILKLSKASATTQFLLREQDLLTLVVYEKAWDRLPELNKILLLRGIFSIISYDSNKDSLVVDSTPYADLFNMRHAKDENGKEYLDNYDNTLELAANVILEIEEEERKAKEEEKEKKAAERAAKKAAKYNKNL
jgi:hypothetical protein